MEGSQSGNGNGTGTGDGGTGAGNGTGNGGTGTGNGAGTGNGSGAGAGTGAGASTTQVPDLTTLDAAQLEKVLENPNLWNLPRVKELREQAAKGKKLEEAAAAAEENALKEQKKFEELATKRGEENAKLKEQLQKSTVDSQLMAKLAPLGVVDLQAALLLINRSEIKVDDNGTITGLDEAVEALKTDKAYLFGQGGNGTSTVGTSTNGNGAGTGNGGTTKFKRSQLRDPKFYQEHREEILKAAAAGQIEDDLSAPRPAQ